MDNYQQTIISQYADSPSLTQIITNINTCIDPQANINAFYSNVWDVDTAIGYGLDVWGRIVGVSRVLQVASGTFFGFSNANDLSEVGWSQTGIWYSGAGATGNFALTDQAFRTLIYAKALYNIWDGSIPGINNILMTLFASSGDAWVVDSGGMKLIYSFSFQLSPIQQSIMGSGVIPIPSGVSFSIRELATAPTVASDFDADFDADF
jgi:hypothetical protein